MTIKIGNGTNEKNNNNTQQQHFFRIVFMQTERFRCNYEISLIFVDVKTVDCINFTNPFQFLPKKK